MKLSRNGEFSMNRQEVAEFSAWLNNNPKERYKQFNEVVQAFIYCKNNEYFQNEWELEEAQ